MLVSDEDYIGDASDDDGDAPRAHVRAGARTTRSSAPRKTKGSDFEVTRTWEQLTEGADGTITSAVENLLEAGKRKRLLKDTTPLQRGIIRHLILILDMSLAMNEKDLRPTRYLLTLMYTTAFINEFFEQNPISQLGIVGMRDGIAVRVSDMSGNPSDHLTAIQNVRKQEPKGNPSLENALEMARAALFHAPSHGTREILVVFGALHTTDPGDIHQTIQSLIQDKISAQVIGLAAQVAICHELVSKTNDGDASGYGVVLHEQHFRELMMAVTTPPVTHNQTQSASTLLMMGFPPVLSNHIPPSVHATHVRLATATSAPDAALKYALCPLNVQLAASHSFSLHISPDHTTTSSRSSIGSKCLGSPPGGASRASPARNRFRTSPLRDHWTRDTGNGRVPTSTSRYECTFCHRHFCIDCDLFAHEVVHNCPGCQSGNTHTSLMGETETENRDAQEVTIEEVVVG